MQPLTQTAQNGEMSKQARFILLSVKYLLFGLGLVLLALKDIELALILAVFILASLVPFFYALYKVLRVIFIVRRISRKLRKSQKAAPAPAVPPSDVPPVDDLLTDQDITIPLGDYTIGTQSKEGTESKE
jgi:hypothetical protein